MDHVKRPDARRDIVECALYIGFDNPRAAERFVTAVEETIQALCRMPGIGKPLRMKDRQLEEMRSHAVRGFGNYLIFYLRTESGVEVVRVLHGARHITEILELERD